MIIFFLFFFLLTLWLLVAVIQNYICGVVHAGCQVLNGTFAKFIHSEDVVVDVGDPVDVVFEHVNAEGMVDFCVETERTCSFHISVLIFMFLQTGPYSHCFPLNCF